MTLEILIAKLQQYVKEHPEHKDMEIRDMNLDIAATGNNLKFEVKNWQMTISNWLFNS